MMGFGSEGLVNNSAKYNTFSVSVRKEDAAGGVIGDVEAVEGWPYSAFPMPRIVISG
jgi:hypothetical protein